jgi:hypothetical protein
MTGRLSPAAVLLVGFLAVNTAPVDAAPIACDKLAALSLPETTIQAAQDVAAGDYTPAGAAPTAPPITNLPAFCRVALTVAPEIHIEIWLPKDTWNGRYRGEGGGGYAGMISYPGLAAGVRAGYATASTDTGHPASAGGRFALNPDKTLNMPLIVDYAERSLHELAIKSKAIIKAYYGNAPAYSYWNGCSTGGRQGLGDRRAGDQLRSLRRRHALARGGDEQDRRRPDWGGQAERGDEGGGCRVRRERWRARWDHQRSTVVHVRPRGARLQER